MKWKTHRYVTKKKKYIAKEYHGWCDEGFCKEMFLLKVVGIEWTIDWRLARVWVSKANNYTEQTEKILTWFPLDFLFLFFLLVLICAFFGRRFGTFWMREAQMHLKHRAQIKHFSCSFKMLDNALILSWLSFSSVDLLVQQGLLGAHWGSYHAAPCSLYVLFYHKFLKCPI